MRHSYCFSACAVFLSAHITAFSLLAQNSSAQNSSPIPADNPFLVESPLPYHLPPFDKIKDEHFVPATEAGMQEQLKEADAIAANAEKATFDNTVVALERTGRLLDRAQRTFSNLNAADTNPAYLMTKSQRRALLPKTSTRKESLSCDYRTRLASRCLGRCKTAPCASGSSRPRSRVIVRADPLILARSFFELHNCERNAPSFSVTKTTPPISWKTRQRKMFRP